MTLSKKTSAPPTGEFTFATPRTLSLHQKPLQDIAERIGAVQTSADPRESRAEGMNVWYYPDYTNAYQELLYERVRSLGARIRSLSRSREIDELVAYRTQDNVFHLHWLNALFKEAGENDDLSAVVEAFLRRVRNFKERGFRFYWTVHNRVSHESPVPELETTLRAQLARMADRIYVHHSLALEELEWLPSDAPIYLAEHGPYRLSAHDAADRDTIRAQLGFAPEDLVVSSIGRLRPYKGLADYLPSFGRVMADYERLKLATVGKITCDETRDTLYELPSDRTFIQDAFVDQQDLERWLIASDYVFLSYRSVLTSGALFHVFSAGTPVIAPALGTIPAYVVDGWNGFLYEDAAGVDRILRTVLSEDRGRRDQRAANAGYTASTLQWRFP